LLYDQVIEALPTIADELKGSNQISQKSVEQLFEQTVEGAMKEFEKNSLQLKSKSVRTQFFKWLASFIDRKDCDDVLGTISEWKRVVFPERRERMLCSHLPAPHPLPPGYNRD